MSKRIVVVEKAKCNPEGCGWYLCARVSPSNRAGKEAFYKDVDGKIAVNEELVSDVDQIAVNKCPFHALKMVRLPEQLDKEPLHRFGKNGFSLYNLPIPTFGNVVGIIGRNGIGKSTAVQILAGLIKPNMGIADKEATQKEIIEYFKGTEAQTYFEKLAKGEMKVSYKPQQVEVISRQYKGSVRDLLKKADERGIFDSIINDLELSKFLDNDIAKISGGELQRVAIAATVMKKANVLIFDEPTSYLDVMQRLKISKYIRGLADENTAVLVIEHDLIILDAMTDLVQPMYGTPGVYGVVTLPKSSKAGINAYLEGFLREENMRFRNHAITFFEKIHEKVQKREQLTTWEAHKETLGKFALSINSGSIDKRDVIGIVGENATGKTTFVKYLAGELDSDKLPVKIAYKPQYLTPTSELVAVFLKNAIMQYNVQIIKPLDIMPLIEKQLDQLSGGELQRVMIAKCLSEDAELLLMDEPSAYLDVEQRLEVSKIIGQHLQETGKAALIVDHDVLFIDYLSEKLIVFEGEPSVKGEEHGPYLMEEGMNHFLKGIGITFRRDEENHRPRVNKLDSQMDKQQKGTGKLYYTR
ncbi:MAG: ribosome biogenesis/translation initiation ATPase RLI [Candidatus Woesearchaeota archaeon]